MAELRPVSNLVVPENLQLDKSALQSNFFYIYRGLYHSPKLTFMTKLWACSLIPSIGNDPDLWKSKTTKKDTYTRWATHTPAGYLSIKKLMGPNPYFIASVPLFAFTGTYTVTSFIEYLSGASLTEQVNPAHRQDITDFSDSLKTDNPQNIEVRDIQGASVINAINSLEPRAKEALKHCLLRIHTQTKGSQTVIFADFKITKEEAQQLTSTHWIELRDIDLYPLLLQWVSTGFGTDGHAPFVSFPISSIGHSLPKNQANYARINDKGIAISPQGRPCFLPKQLNQTLLYEDRYTNAGAQDDGSYALRSLKTSETNNSQRKLPHNLPVLIDWINNKYSFTKTSGLLEIMDLTRYQSADISHIRTLLEERVLTDKRLTQISALGIPANVPTSAFAQHLKGMENVAGSEELGAWYSRASLLFSKEEGRQATFGDIQRQGYPLFIPIAKYLQQIKDAVLNNIDAVYEKYSVTYVMEQLAWLILIVDYASDLADVKARDLANRKAAIDQSVTQGWKPSSIPLLSDKVGILPHQKKVRNLLKDSPDLAILPVQAGGGKSMIILTDVLYEIKANRNQPYLILCPGHLVANYVKEIVFFTGGKLNVIAINSYVINQNGLPRLQAMLEHAPRNTVVVADYDVTKLRQKSFCYGTTPVTVFPIIDFLKQFNFGYVACDESHKLKNDTARTRATMSLINDIKKKRLASGTMAHDSPSDLAMQIASLDPTLFGTREEFNTQYGAEVQGDRVVTWKPGAQREILRKIKSRIVVAGAMRKEWAALLPTKTEWIKGVNLTPAQYNVYNDILEQVLERIKEDAKKNKALQKILNGDNEENDEEDPTEDLSALLKPYLARLEQFMVAPASDPLGEKVLKGDDRISPKALMIVERIRLHIEKKIPGKVLIFTNYVESAEEIFRIAGPAMQKSGILYTAANKLEDGDRFERDDTVKWMVGVEQSMNEGLNFQFASRLIRCETVWNPGTLEQGDSRINRPELKKAENRNEIFYDWILVNRSIDITKMSRLIAKVVAVAKFENIDNPEYESIPDVPVIKMSLDNIQNLNSWEENLTEYGEAYSTYQQVRDAEYAEYKQKYRDDHNGEDPSLSPLTVAPNPPDAKLMRRVPYPSGLDIYGAAEAGLIRLDEYLNKPEFETEEDEDEDTDVEDNGQNPLWKSLIGTIVHTEFGEGIIQRIGQSRRVTIHLFSGFSVWLRKSSVFVVTRTETSTKDIRNQLLKSIGDLPIDKPIDVPATGMKNNAKALKLLKEKEVIQKQKKQKQLVEALNVELQFTITNGFLGISYFLGEDDIAAKALQAVGFRADPQFYYAKMANAARLKKQLDLWQEKGFRPDATLFKQGLRNVFAELYNLLKSGRIKNHQDTIKVANAAQVRNFYRLEHKASNDKLVFKPYPIIEDNVAYIALPVQGQTASKNAIRVKAPGVKWVLSSPTLSFFGSPSQISQKMKQIIEAGITVSNLADLKVEFKKVKKMPIRSEEALDKIIGEL